MRCSTTSSIRTFSRPVLRLTNSTQTQTPTSSGFSTVRLAAVRGPRPRHRLYSFRSSRPAGLYPLPRKARLRQRLEALDGGAHSAAFLRIESVVNAWVASTETDATDYIRRVLLAVQPSDNLTWYGFEANHRPPNDVGVFADQPFGIREPQE